MAYADSAIDYKYEIEELRVADQYMRVRYYTADSNDGRPDLHRNFEVLANKMDSASIHEIIQYDAVGIVTIWDKYIEASAIDSSELSHLVGTEFSDRYKVRYEEEFYSLDSYDWLKFKQVQYDSEGADEITRKFNLVAMDSDEKDLVSSRLVIPAINVRDALAVSGHLDSVEAVLGYSGGTSPTNERVLWEYSAEYSNLDSIGERIQAVLGLNDSDFAHWIKANVDGSQPIDGPFIEYLV